MIGKKCSIILLTLLSTTVVFIIYQCEQWSLIFVSFKFTNQSVEELPSRSDLNDCILSFFVYYKLESLLEKKNQTLPIYLSFHSQQKRYDDLGKECTSLFYRGQEELMMKSEEKSCFYPFPISPQERQDIQKALYVIKSGFDKNNLELVLTGGSFIGSWRYHQIIPYDDDIDFYIRSEEKPMIRVLLENLSHNKTNRFVFKDTENQNQHWKLGILCSGNSKSTCKIELDFFFLWEEGSELRFLEWPMSFEKSDYLPLRQRPFENLLFKVPKSFERFMMRQYEVNATQCYFKNHASTNGCRGRSVNCDLLKYRYPYKLTGYYRNLFIELIVYKMNVQSLFIDSIN